MSTPNNNDDPKKHEEEHDIFIEHAVPAEPEPVEGGPVLPAGSNRFYCEKCRAPYDLPKSATSWRCVRCATFNSITPAECPMCTIL